LEHTKSLGKHFEKSMRKNAILVTVILIILGISIAMSFASEKFLTVNNITNILLQSTMIIIVGIGMAYILILGGIDLSAGSVMALTSLLVGEFVINGGMNPVLGVVVCIGIGTLCGLVNGLLISKLGMMPFLATLGTMSVYRGLGQALVNGQVVYDLPDELMYAGAGMWGSFPVAFVIALVLCFLSWIVLKRTSFGTYVYAIGGNAQASKLSGIPVGKIKILSYTIGGALFGVAGLISLGRMGGTYLLTGSSFEMYGITACAVGGISLAGGEGNVWGALVGGILVQLIRNSMTQLSISNSTQMVINGVVILVAVAIDCFRRRLREKKTQA